MGGVPAEGERFLRNVSFSLIFWRPEVFLKTDGLAGVERGVGGVAVPSSCGVLCPVVFASVCDGSIEISAGEVTTS